MSVITITEQAMRVIGDKLYDNVRCSIYEWQVPKNKLIFFDGEDLVPGLQGEFFDINGDLIRCLIQVWVADKDYKVSSRVGYFDSHWTGSDAEKERDRTPMFFLDCGGASYDNKLSKWGGGMARRNVVGLPEERIAVHVITTAHHKLDMKRSWIKLTIMQRTGTDPKKKS
jgi:hypothetical protein